MNENIFEVATRSKMRFPFIKGALSVEDLWDLTVKELDSIFKTLNARLKEVKEESLLSTRSSEDKALDIMIEIVKYIVQVKLDEDVSRSKAKENKEKKQKLLEILAQRQDANLLSKSEDEIKQMLANLDK